MTNRFDPKKVQKLSTLKEYREISMEIDLKPGNYAIVPRYSATCLTSSNPL